jgi:hypothetical protein
MNLIFIIVVLSLHLQFSLADSSLLELLGERSTLVVVIIRVTRSLALQSSLAFALGLGASRGYSSAGRKFLVSVDSRRSMFDTATYPVVLAFPFLAAGVLGAGLSEPSLTRRKVSISRCMLVIGSIPIVISGSDLHARDVCWRDQHYSHRR